MRVTHCAACVGTDYIGRPCRGTMLPARAALAATGAPARDEPGIDPERLARAFMDECLFDATEDEIFRSAEAVARSYGRDERP